MGVLLLLVALLVVAIGWLTLRPPDAAPRTAAPTPFAGAATPVVARSPSPASTERRSSGIAAASPSAPGTSSSPVPPASGAAASGPLDPAVAAQIAAIETQVPPIRGLEPLRAVPNRILDPAALRSTLERMLGESEDPGTRAAEEALLKRLGFLPQDADLETLFLDLYSSQVAGFYDSRSEQFYVVQRAGEFGPQDKIVVAHEYTHALQDQHFDLEKIQATDDSSETDRSLAHLGLIEGDATLLMFQWATQHLDVTELLGLLGAGGVPGQDQSLAGVPPLLQRQLLFPYLDGMAFATVLHDRGGWAAVDAAYADPPGTTEQILHPEKYLNHERAVAIDLPDVSRRLGAGWRRSATETLGELYLQVWAANGAAPAALPGAPQPGADAASGWGGDRVESYDGPDGQWAVVWVTAWDTVSDATEFLAAADTVTHGTLGNLGETQVLNVDGAGHPGGAGDRVMVVLTSRGILPAVQGALGIGD